MPLRITPAVKALLISCFAMFILQQTADRFFDADLEGWLALIPATFVISHRFWQLFSYAFLHADVMHLVLNLMMLAFIGGELEAVWGTAKFLRYYFFCSMTAGLVYLLLQIFVWKGLHTPMVGASGAIYGLLMAYGLLFGERVLLFMMIFPIKAKYFVMILGGIEFMTTVFSGRSGLASAAHLSGMASGFIYLWVGAAILVARRKRKQGLDPRRPKKRRPPSKHLKLVINNDMDSDDDVDDSPKTWH